MRNRIELLSHLVWVDITSRYKQTKMGGAWALFEPFISMVVFAIAFNRIGETEANNIIVAYPVFLYSGLLPWIYFKKSLSKSVTSLVSNATLLNKVNIDKENIILTPLFSNLFDYSIAFLILLILMTWFRTEIIFSTIYTIPIMFGIFIFSYSLSLILSIINAIYRDVRQLIPFVIQFWMFLTPIIYPASFIDSKYQIIIKVNPLVGYIKSFRAVILGTEFDRSELIYSFLITAIIFFVGKLFFNKYKTDIVDIL